MFLTRDRTLIGREVIFASRTLREELLLIQEQEWRGETIHETRLLLPPFTV
jgi:hypothetical protein